MGKNLSMDDEVDEDEEVTTNGEGEGASKDADDVLFGVETLVAGKRIRALGGNAEFECDARSPMGLTITLPWCADENPERYAQTPENDDVALNILVGHTGLDLFLPCFLAVSPERHHRFPGFAVATDPQHVVLRATIAKRDPLSEALIQGTITTRPAFIEVYREGGQLFYRPVGEEKQDGVLLYSS